MIDYKKSSRKDCFLGLHFDFHAMEGETVGTIIDIASIERMLDVTQPDLIQVDTKGHPGISSYETKAGVLPQQLNMNVLSVWREVTAKRGIRLYAHHSGLFDQAQAKIHPEWAVVSSEGVVSKDYMSPFSPYVDKILIPQMLEIAGEYHADGIWVDGECWGAFVDYSDNAQYAWKRKKGEQEVIPYPGDEKYEEYREFCRQGFRDYVTHYVTTVKKQYPHFEITSNWLYSYYVPEKREIPIDFISGDYSCYDSVRKARVIGRTCSNQDLTWDMIGWGQNAIPASWETRNRCTKEATQLCQEAAVTLALGGGFQFFNILYGTGGLVQEWAIDNWREVAEFCRQREEFCFHAKSLADIAVVFPSYYKNRKGREALFIGGAWKNVSNWVAMIKDAGYSCDIINETNLTKLDSYKVVVMPTATVYQPETRKQIEVFAKNGGIVIVDGGVNIDEKISGVNFLEGKNKLLFLDGKGRLSALETVYYEPELTMANDFLYCQEQNYFYEPEKHISGVIHRHGKGKVISLCTELGPVYGDNITYALKQYIKSMFEGCEYVPLVSVEGSDYADVTLMEKDGHIMVNIINMAGEHSVTGVRTFREIPKIGPLRVKVRTKQEPGRVIWQPEGKELKSIKTDDGYIYIIDSLEIHGILQIERE